MIEDIKTTLEKFGVKVNSRNLLQELFDTIPQKITIDNSNYWFVVEKLTDASWRLNYSDALDYDNIIVEICNDSLEQALINMFVWLNDNLES